MSESDSNSSSKGSNGSAPLTERERIIGRMQQEEQFQREYGTAVHTKNGNSDRNAATRRSARKPFRRPQVGKGVGLVFLLHSLVLFAPGAFVIIGLIQWLYVIPVLFLNRQDPGLMRGIWIAAGATFALNAIWLLFALNG